MVSTLDSESSDPSSNLGGTFLFTLSQEWPVNKMWLSALCQHIYEHGMRSSLLRVPPSTFGHVSTESCWMSPVGDQTCFGATNNGPCESKCQDGILPITGLEPRTLGSRMWRKYFAQLVAWTYKQPWDWDYFIDTKFYSLSKDENEYPGKFLNALCFASYMQFENSFPKRTAPNVGLEPTTLRLRVSCSTDWASRAYKP